MKENTAMAAVGGRQLSFLECAYWDGILQSNLRAIMKKKKTKYTVS